jgi:hypothetical protein
MSLIDKIIRTSLRPRSFWIAFLIGAVAPVIALPYVILVNSGVINHGLFGFFFFVVLWLVAFASLIYYYYGQLRGRYKDLSGRSWSELPW